VSVELGHFSLILAFAIAVMSAVGGLLLWRRGEQLSMTLSQAAILQFVLVAMAFLALVHAFVVSDFSVALAANHSHSLKPLIFKISGVWGNHEGSLLLWILILVLFGALVAAFGRRLPSDLLNLVLGAQSLLTACFAGFTLITSNPFERLVSPPLEGADLNPILQDIGLAIHPPLLYAGYVGFSICFSFAIAALVSGRIDQAWARWVRPWTMLSWIFLTLGMAMGSYWAYYELGWGGWWFWDPVENASFMPWLAGTALLHSALVMEKRNALKIWTVFLAIITFSLSLLGTFLVRSGILTSVHTFASDPTRGLVILSILAVLIGGAFILFAIRAPSLRHGGLFAPISREGALILNNLFLATAVGAVLVGTLYPLLRADRHDNFGWCAVLRLHLRRADGASIVGTALWAAAGLEACRSGFGGTAPHGYGCASRVSRRTDLRAGRRVDLACPARSAAGLLGEFGICRRTNRARQARAYPAWRKPKTPGWFAAEHLVNRDWSSWAGADGIGHRFCYRMGDRNRHNAQSGRSCRAGRLFYRL
jgi:cytochrome c biogenesis factor